MKIIKKLCIPLFSLVLVLGCFAVSQMDASAIISDYICPKHYSRMILSDCYVIYEKLEAGGYKYNHMHTYICTGPGCHMSDTRTIAMSTPIPCSVGGSGGGGGGTDSSSHTHNYSTAWGGWRKISSCRLPG